MQLKFYIPSPNWHGDAIRGILDQRSETKQHMPSEKCGFYITFAKDTAAENFRVPKISTPANYDFATGAKQKENVSSKYVCGRRASKLRNAVGNGEYRFCFEKIQKIPVFY